MYMKELMTAILNETLADHAEFELDRVGLFEPDSDYEGMIGQAVMELIKTFASQGHSGCSAGITRDLFNRLSNYETLSSITDDPAEWMEVTDMTIDGNPLHQCRRNPSFFSKDSGKTYYHVDDQDTMMTSEKGTVTEAVEDDFTKVPYYRVTMKTTTGKPRTFWAKDKRVLPNGVIRYVEVTKEGAVDFNTSNKDIRKLRVVIGKPEDFISEKPARLNKHYGWLTTDV
jgi:hypothetical protein